MEKTALPEPNMDSGFSREEDIGTGEGRQQALSEWQSLLLCVIKVI